MKKQVTPTPSGKKPLPIWEMDPMLAPFRDAILARSACMDEAERRICAAAQASSLRTAVNNHLHYGLHRTPEGGWVFREYAPNASRIFLVGDCSQWKRLPGFQLSAMGGGDWELRMPPGSLSHGQLYKLFVEWPGGGGERLPSYVRRVVQDPETKIFSAQVWEPPVPYAWKHPHAGPRPHPFVYECHIGMSSEEGKVASFEEFRTQVLPRICRAGYDTVQIMALQEHPYYGSFGYQVSNFFALSSRFGTPEEFKRLVDDAHGAGLAVVMDLVHSHSVDNEAEGLSRFDGREDLYFHAGPRGRHPAWGSRCFDYGKEVTRHFLLSNVKFWMEEYRLDGFRFDGVTSMLYADHGLGRDFGDYAGYFGEGVDEDALTYLGLACRLARQVHPDAITIAEDVSAMPGLAAPVESGGVGFGFRLSMGVADHWIKWIKEKRDEQWSAGEIWWELTRHRAEERTISYAECHDQALVGDKTIIFRLIDKDMYDSMRKDSQNPTVDRGIALHKIIRLVTAATAGDGYLNFMGNEFGHPEWIDFPREGNGWSFHYARRQWSLSDNPDLRYGGLAAFDAAMVSFLREEGVLGFPPEILVADEQKQVLVFRRGHCIFGANFSPSGSFADYALASPEGKYRHVFDSDEVRFGGFGRLSAGTLHLATPERCPNGNPDFTCTLRLYLPARCAMVLKKEDEIWHH